MHEGSRKVGSSVLLHSPSSSIFRFKITKTKAEALLIFKCRAIHGSRWTTYQMWHPSGLQTHSTTYSDIPTTLRFAVCIKNVVGIRLRHSLFQTLIKQRRKKKVPFIFVSTNCETHCKKVMIAIQTSFFYRFEDYLMWGGHIVQIHQLTVLYI